MKLIIFSGLPGTGKSTLSQDVGRRLAIPVFAKDWLEATLVRCELIPSTQARTLGSAGYELLTMLAERQLMLGQSVILDSVASTQNIRNIWKHLADRYQATWRVIECICSNESFHQAQLINRERHIPGWHELQWSEVEKVREYFSPWVGDRLILDMMHPFEKNLAQAVAYCV